MKWIFRLFGILLALIVILIGAVFLLPADRLARIATDQLTAATGRSVAINGDVSLTFWPVLGVSADGLEIGNAEWAAQGPMFEADNAAIGVDVISVLSGDVRVTNIEAHSPTIRLEQKLDGRGSWQFDETSGSREIPDVKTPEKSEQSSASPEAASLSQRSISIERLEITDATLIFDAEGSELVSLSGVDLSLDWPDPAGAAQVIANVRPAASDVAVDLTVDALSALIDGEVSALRGKVSTQSGEVSLDGRASTDGAVAGTVSLSAENTDALLQAFGLPAVDLPQKLGRSLDIKTEMTLTPDRQLALRELRVDLGGNEISGAADLSLNDVPQINARFDAGDLDLKPATGGSSGSDGGSGSGNSSGSSNSSGGAGGSSSTSNGWPKDTIDASGLAAFNGDIALSANSIDLGDFKLGQTRAVLRNENSRMVFDLREVAAYGGDVTGEFVINNRSGLSVGGRMSIAGVQMQPLLADAIDMDRLTGRGDLKLSFLGAGSNVDAIMRSLSGDGDLKIGRGTLEGINLDQLLTGGATSGTTIFNDLTATWTIASGVLTNRDLLLQLKNYRASGEGTVNLGRQRMDYVFTPVALRANSGQGLAVPVIFEGPWSNVSIRPDVQAILEAELEEERKELERKAKEKALDSLGIKKKGKQSTEDTIKDKLLRNLFD
ncbi:MAG: AsmA family protein [Paracoccaceae bacterium]